MPDRRPWLIPLAFGLVYVIWGSTYLAIRIAIDTIPPFLMAGTRFLAAGVVLYAVARLAGAPKPAKGEWGPASIVGLFLLLGGNGLVVFGQKTVPSGLASLIVAGVALWMALFEALRPGGRWPSLPVAIGLLGGFAGVALLIGPWGGGVDPAGAVAPVGAVGWGGFSLHDPLPQRMLGAAGAITAWVAVIPPFSTPRPGAAPAPAAEPP